MYSFHHGGVVSGEGSIGSTSVRARAVKLTSGPRSTVECSTAMGEQITSTNETRGFSQQLFQSNKRDIVRTNLNVEVECKYHAKQVYTKESITNEV